MKFNKLSILDPGGNITAIIQDDVSFNLRSSIAEKLLQKYNTNKQPENQIEQIAFEDKPENDSSIGKLSLVGNEFSGNALRCYTYLKLAIQNKGSQGLFEISGSKAQLSGKIKNSNYITSQIPIIANQTSLQKSEEGYTIVPMNGISYLIIEDFCDKSENFQLKKGLEIIKKNKWTSKLASGILFVEKYKLYINIKPYVYFRKGMRYDLYKETSCGSGSCSLGIEKYFADKKDVDNLIINQPSGNSINVTVKKNDNRLKAWIGGKVKLLYQGQYNFN